MKLKLIYARASNGVIGLNNQMPWHLPEDLAHFKRTTLGCPVLMGRKTWESIPVKFRPLPGRANLVLTRQQDWQAEGAWVVHTLEEGLSLALAHCPNDKDLWVMGGAEIYAQAAAFAEEAVVTEIDASYEGDAFAPTLGSTWHEVSRESHVSTSGLNYSFVTYQQSISTI
jgi:dihydrofolate reductase